MEHVILVYKDPLLEQFEMHYDKIVVDFTPTNDYVFQCIEGGKTLDVFYVNRDCVFNFVHMFDQF